MCFSAGAANASVAPEETARNDRRVSTLRNVSRPASRWKRLTLLGVSIDNTHSEWRLGFFRLFHVVGLLGLGRVVVAPEPHHLGGKFGGAVAAVVGALAEAEVKIVSLELQRIGHTNVGERPAPVSIIFLVLRSVLHPDANVAFRL